MDEKAVRVLVFLLGGAVLVAARRWKNNDPYAGYAIAGWAMFGAIVVGT